MKMRIRDQRRAPRPQGLRRGGQSSRDQMTIVYNAVLAKLMLDA
jgi:hypothetical protein